MWNPDDYRHRKKEILKILEDYDIMTEVPFVTTFLGVPLIVIWTFIEEDMEEYREFASSEKKRLKEFYGIR